MENVSNFNNYPHRVFASVVLIDGKIANWKTGNYRWTTKSFWYNTQPRMVFKTGTDITIRSKSFVVKNLEEHSKAFSKDAINFYKKFELINNYGLAKPY